MLCSHLQCSCMDLDGDGVLSMYELEYFYEEQQHRMESIGIETLPFEDCLCQMLDMVKPKRVGFVTLGDLKRCKTTPIFFDTFFNLEKYMEHEQRDPFATQRDQDEVSCCGLPEKRSVGVFIVNCDSILCFTDDRLGSIRCSRV